MFVQRQKMHYFSIKIKFANYRYDDYYVEANRFISKEEMKDYVAQVAVANMLPSSDENEEFDILDPVELSEEEVCHLISDITLRSKLIITSLSDIDNVFFSVYHEDADYPRRKTESFIFSASAGQEADVTSIGRTDADTDREKVFFDGWLDCISQLKRYFQVSGLSIAAGLFTIQTISDEAYEVELSEREVVLF